MKSRCTCWVENEKGDNSEHNLPAMQSMRFETTILSSVAESRETTNSGESVPSIPV